VNAEALVDRILPVVRNRLPAGVTADYFDSFVRRNRTALVAILAQQLAARGTGNRNGARSSGDHAAEAYAQPPDLWSASQRTVANLTAMRLAARKRSEEMTAEDRAMLAAYSGWGGLSLQAVADQFPTGFPVPEERGLIQERLRLRNFVRRLPPSAARPSSCAALDQPHSQPRPRRPRPPPAPRPRAPGSRPPVSRCPP